MLSCYVQQVTTILPLLKISAGCGPADYPHRRGKGATEDLIVCLHRHHYISRTTCFLLRFDFDICKEIPTVTPLVLYVIFIASNKPEKNMYYRSSRARKM